MYKFSIVDLFASLVFFAKETKFNYFAQIKHFLKNRKNLNAKVHGFPFAFIRENRRQRHLKNIFKIWSSHFIHTKKRKEEAANIRRLSEENTKTFTQTNTKMTQNKESLKNELQHLCDKMLQLDIKYQEYSHPPISNIKDVMTYIDDISGAKCKNLFLRDKKNNFYLFTTLADTEVDMKTLSKKLCVSNIRFSNEESIKDLLSTMPSAISPFSLIYDSANKVKLILDENIKKEEFVVLHALSDTNTWIISKNDLIKFCENIGHFPLWINLDDENQITEKANQNTGSYSSLGGNVSSDPLLKSHVSSSHESADDADLGITAKKEENFAEWYTQVLTRSDMLEYYDISGCYIMRPWSYFIWESVQCFFDKEIKKIGVENCYFPMFVTKTKLETEKRHIEGFKPEVAWVCKYGEHDLAEQIALRPSSETIMYPSFSKWIRSHRDLPLRLNMWNTVVRWEFRQATPFIRNREFLWQEGHTAHSDRSEALHFVLTILDLYTRWYEEYLAVPVIKGWKSEKEKFGGSEKSSTIEAFIPENGRGIQAATSHLLGTNFSKMFNILYEDNEGKKQYAWQTSWGCTTRSIGVMTMTHSDNKGLVLPPKVAKIQVVIIPITYKDNSKCLLDKCNEIKTLLENADVRVKLDDRSNYTPGWKYNHWELKGVPIRVEVGSKDLKNKSVRVVRRDTWNKVDVSWDGAAEKIKCILNEIQESLLKQARVKLQAGIVKIKDFSEVMSALNNKKIILAPWCGIEETEEQIRIETQRLTEAQQQDELKVESNSTLTSGMKTLCIPFDQPKLDSDTMCFYTKKPAVCWSYWGRSY